MRTNDKDSSTKYSHRSGVHFNLGLLIVPIIAFFLVRQVSDSDMWFHMAVGKQILETGSLPTADHLSLLNYGQPINAYLWLFQTVIAAGYPLAGFWWLQIIQVAILGLALFFIFRSTRTWTSSPTAWLLLLSVAIASSERFTVRPEIVSIIMIAVYYYRLQQGRYYSVADLTTFFLLQAIWSNSHGIFVIGPALAGCYLVEAIIKGMMGKGHHEITAIGILNGIIAIACFATPFGLGNIQYAWRLFVESNPMAPQLSNSTYEMAAALGSVSRTLLPFWFYLFLIVSFLTSWLAVVIYRNRQLPIAHSLIGFLLLAASLTGMKNIPIFAVVAAPLIAENLSLLDSRLVRRICCSTVVAVMAVAATIWSPRPALNYLITWVPYRFGLGVSADYVPVKLPKFLDAINFSGPIFNSMEQGGFYEYHGYPSRISFYDSRLQDYNPRELISTYEAVVNAFQAPANWHALERHYGFRGILLGNLPDDNEASGLLPLISADPSWRLVYLDYAASFWVRTDGYNSLPALGQSTVDSLIDNITNFAQAENIDFILEKTGRYPELRLKLLEKATRRWENPLLLISLGMVKMQAGNLADAEKLFQRVLRLKPQSRLTLTTLAQLALSRGDQATAEKYILTALRYYPDDAELHENLDIIRTRKRQMN